MSMFCSISGTVPSEPVATSTGYIFERRLLDKYIAEQGRKCPISQEELDIDNGIITLNSKAVPPVEGETLSIPELLKRLQDEYDITVLECFKLRQAVDTLKGQISHSLYQHDAACRVIARLMREKKALNDQLEDIKLKGGSALAASDAGSSTAGLSQSILDEITEMAGDLHKTRKNRVVSRYPVEDLSKFSKTAEHQPHEVSNPGINAICIKEEDNLMFTAGEDGAFCVSDYVKGGRLTRHVLHQKAVTCLDVHPDINVVISGSKDKTMKVSLGGESGTYKTLKTMRAHEGALSSVCFHPIGSLGLSASMDGSAVIHEIETGKLLHKIQDSSCEDPIYQSVFHPDGNVIFNAQSGSIKLFDIRTISQNKFQHQLQVQNAKLEAKVFSVCVNENGFTLASFDSTGECKVWDLRKNTEISTLNVKEHLSLAEDQSVITGGTVRFEQGGSLVACGAETSSGKGVLSLGSFWIKGKTKDFEFAPKPLSVGTSCRSVDYFKNGVISVGGDNIVRVWQH